jgi:hypothetical protein
MDTKKKIIGEKPKKKGLLDLVVERPLFTILFLFMLTYLLWYFFGGPARAELKYNSSGWLLVFKHLFKL